MKTIIILYHKTNIIFRIHPTNLYTRVNIPTGLVQYFIVLFLSHMLAIIEMAVFAFYRKKWLGKASLSSEFLNSRVGIVLLWIIL